jgi:predicted ATPase/DNA-binding SARP family transcriptional activator
VPEAAWRLRKARSLVKLLALAPGHRRHREEVVEVLWSDQEPKAAEHNLQQTLYIARRALDPGASGGFRYLALQGPALVLSPADPVWTDLEAFAAAAEAARREGEPVAYRAALDLYAGDLLPEDRFEDWVGERREQLRREYLGLLTDLASLLEARGDEPAAMASWGRVLAEDPASEGAHRGLMRLYARTDRRQEALRQYQALVEVLRRELDIEPEPASRALYREILEGRFRSGGAGAEGEGRKRPQERPPEAGTGALPAPGGSRTNLPARLSSFVGRGREMAQIGRILARTRLLTLTGAGGCGKTTLALATAAGLRGEFRDGVWLVELAALDDPNLVPHAVGHALGLREEPGRSLEAALGTFLSAKQLLLVLDNCEHLAEACAKLADRLLRACPELRILATSREALRSEGEMTWVVPSLSLPDARQDASPEELEASEAVRLFVDRAGAVLPGWGLGGDNGAAVARICRRLDGIPLAIELAAARVNVLSVGDIATRLEADFSLLSGGNRTALPRHQSLRATLDWSYGLLSEPAQGWFRRLGVFAGSFTLEAAEAVCGEAGGRWTVDGGDEPSSALDLLSELVNKSLVVADPGGEGLVRYRLLEPLRQYAWGRLVEGGEAAAARRRHAWYYAALAEGIEPYLTAPAASGFDQGTWFDRLAAEHDNLRVAFREAVEREEPEMALRLVGALWRFWFVRGHHGEGQHRLEEALTQRIGAASRFRAKALLVAVFLAFAVGDLERTTRLAAEGLALFRELGDSKGIADALLVMGMSASSLAAFGRAEALWTESLALYRTLRDKQGVGLSLGYRSVARQAQGDPEGVADLEEGLTLLCELGDQLSMAMILESAAYLAHDRGDPERAAALSADGLSRYFEIGDRRGVAGFLWLMAADAIAQGRSVRAARLLGAAESLHQAVGSAPSPSWRAKYERNVAAVRTALGEEAFAAAWAVGRQMSMEQATKYARTP